MDKQYRIGGETVAYDTFIRELNTGNYRTEETESELSLTFTGAADRAKRSAELKARMQAISEDLLQVQAGETVPGIEARKAEFVQLHNELRILEGKTPRTGSV